MIYNTCLVTGGARSGKSRYAQSLAESGEHPFYIATGWAGDDEMKKRIAKHQADRGKKWSTIETKTDLIAAIREASEKGADFILVDCLTLWVSNLMMEGKNPEKHAYELAAEIADFATPVVFVTNELGCGVVPENKLAREFRDAAGLVNQTIAAAVESVVFCVSGIPQTIKP